MDDDTLLQWESKNVRVGGRVRAALQHAHSVHKRACPAAAQAHEHMHAQASWRAGASACAHECGCTLAQGRPRHVALARVRRFQRGQETDVFRRRPQPLRALLSFSIMYQEE